MLTPVPTLGDLVADHNRAITVPAEAVPEILGELEQLRAILWSRLIARDSGSRSDAKDRLLTADEAAQKLAVSKDWIYRHKHKLPFFVPVGREVRFSERGIELWIKRRAGR